MGQYDNGFPWENEQDDDDEKQTGKALRDARDIAAKEARDLKKQLDDVMKQLTERNLKDVLQGKSLNPGLAKWISQDGIDGSDAAKVDEWLTTNAELIGYKPAVPEEQAEPDARAAEFARMQGIQSNALPAGKLSEAAARIANADNIEDINAALRSAR
jgi:hypothetical protein